MTDRPIFVLDLFRGETALITGGGTGIGFAIARELGSLGAKVVIAARNVERLAAAAAQLRSLGIDAAHCSVNIRDETEVAALFDSLERSHGIPDILVNNAGGQFQAPALGISANGFRAVVDLNLNGTWHMCHGFARRAIDAGRGGRIVNIVLTCLAGGRPGYAHAAAARSGVLTLTETLAAEWARFGITVNAVAPGSTETSALDQYDREELEADVRGQPIARWASPREIALAVAYLVSPAASYVTGIVLPVDGGKRLNFVPPG